MNINSLSLEEKIGQLFLVSFEENAITDEIKILIQKYKIGGVILYRKSSIDYDNLLKLINELKELNKNNPIPLFISIDQEGGRVNRLPKSIINLKAAYKLTKNKDLNIIEQASEITAKILKDTGYNMNFAPVLDIKNFNENHPIGDRCFGDNLEDVCKFGIASMKTYQNNGIIPVIKHFPRSRFNQGRFSFLSTNCY